MNRPQLTRVTIVIAACASAGAIAGIAGSAAAPSSTASKAKPAPPAQAQPQGVRARAFRFGPRPFGFGFGPVHAEAVIPKPDGSGFLTVTTDAGTLNSVDGTTLHLKEGTDKATYKADAAVDVGSGAKVFRNGKQATLSDLKSGDHVRVITGGPRGNVVVAEDAASVAQQQKQLQQFKKQFRQLKRQFRERGMRHGGFGFRLGPPPGAPAPGAYPGGPDAPGAPGWGNG
jgi:hypothetical protein